MNITIEKILVNSFGKLKNIALSAEKGINVLSAPNESGKSTLASFVKFVFYGFAGTRLQNLADNERKLYTPWDGEVSEGSIAIVADGTKYVVHRRCLASGKEECQVINRATGKPEFAGLVPGEVFFGVGEEIFSRTLFFRQLTVPANKDDVLADRLRDIAISADEQVSTQKALKKLNDAKNDLKGRSGNGLIPKAEAERDALEEEITQAVDLRREVERINTEIKKRSQVIAAGEQQLAELRAERENIEKYESYLRLQSIKRLADEEMNAREDYEKTSAGLKCRADSRAFGELSAKNAELVAEQRSRDSLEENLKKAQKELEELKKQLPFDVAEAEKIQRMISGGKTRYNIFIALALAGFVASGILALAVSILAAIAVSCVAMAFFVCSYFSLKKPVATAKKYGMNRLSELVDLLDEMPEKSQKIAAAEKNAESAEKQYNESVAACQILNKELEEDIRNYAEFSENDSYSKQIEQILAMSAESGEKLALWRAKKEEYDRAIADVDMDVLAENARNAVEPNREKNIVDRDISFYTKQISQLSELNRRDELESAAFEAKSGDPAALVGKRDALCNTIDELTTKHKAYEKAMAVMNESGDYMKSMVAPRISSRADDYFRLATDGKYSAFEIDTRVSMSFGEDERRSCDYLSAGTRDSAYLSLRLALADMLFADGVPMILDDAFVRLDDERLKMMAKALKEASEKHQIFIFTHGEREINAFNSMKVSYNSVEFNNF